MGQSAGCALNLGSGADYREGMVNVDLYAEKSDLRHDLREPLPFADGEVDFILASHVIEHFSRLEWQSIKADWFRVLRPGGVLEVRCPDTISLFQNFIDDKDGRRWSLWILGVYGEQERMGEGQFHKNGFTGDRLAADLTIEGFAIDKIDIDEDRTELKILAKKVGK